MKRLRELLEQLTLHFQVEIAIADILEDLGSRLKKQEDRNLRDDVKFNSLEKRYSEILMVVKEINRKIDKANNLR